MAEDAAAPSPPGADRLLAALEGFGRPVHVPDLSAARLTVDRVALLRGADGEARLHIGYRGTRGCQVSLLALPARDLPERLTLVEAARTRAYVWRAGTVGYALLATGMDRTRFDLVARTVARATRERAPVTRETRTALARSRAESAPCLG